MDKSVEKLKWYRPVDRPAAIALAVTIGVILVIAFCICIGIWSGLELEKILNSRPWSLITGLAAAPTALLIWYWRDKAKTRDQQQKDKDLKIAQENQYTERFATAVKLLGDKSMEIRLGGIYALERLAKDSLDDHWPVMETLSAFIRENAPLPPENLDETEDLQDTTEGETPTPKKNREVKTSRIAIQAALTVIGRRPEERRKYEDEHSYRIDLSNSNLDGLNLTKVHLENADFNGAHLGGADLSNAHLEVAILWKAHLEGAILRKAHLEMAILFEAHLEGADFNEANLYEVLFEGADLRGAKFEGANLGGAKLERAKYNSKALDFTDDQIPPTSFPEGFDPKEHGMIDEPPLDDKAEAEESETAIAGGAQGSE